MSRIFSPRWMTPPTENTVSATTRPAYGERISMRPSTALAFMAFGITSSILAWVSRKSLVTSAIRSLSSCAICCCCGDRLASLGNVGHGIGDLPLQAKGGALQLQDARASDQPSLDQRRDVLGFRTDRR